MIDPRPEASGTSKVNRSFKDRDLRTLTIRCSVLYKEPGRSSEVRHMERRCGEQTVSDVLHNSVCARSWVFLRLERELRRGSGVLKAAAPPD